MDSYLEWFFVFITSMFGPIWQGIKSMFLALINIFNFSAYFGQFSQMQGGFGVVGWLFAVLSIVLVYLFWASLVFLLVLVIRKYLRFRETIVANEDLLEEIDTLHRDVIRLTSDKERILAMKSGVAIPSGGEIPLVSADIDSATLPDAVAVDSGIVVATAKDPALTESEPRFYRLSSVDEKFANYDPLLYGDEDVTLQSLCEDIRNFACSHAHLFYELKTIRLMIAGFASTKMILLQGISGTGKTSLPYIMGKFFCSDATIASVQPSWRDRSELFGFFNEFTKKFNETETLRRIYESSYNDDINIIVLDEMNIARVEYYFAEMLSILEMPDRDEWKIQLVPSVWANDPVKLKDGKLTIPSNVWYVGTANNDDSTFAVSDKVYDRAFVINLDNKGVPFDAPATEPRRVSYSHVEQLYLQAVAENPISDEMLANVEKLDNYVIEHFRVAFGNRIMKQLQTFIPVYTACGGNAIEGLDYILTTKVFRKFESLNLVLIRDEIKGLINFLDTLFGKGVMSECIAFLRRLQKSY